MKVREVSLQLWKGCTRDHNAEQAILNHRHDINEMYIFFAALFNKKKLQRYFLNL